MFTARLKIGSPELPQKEAVEVGLQGGKLYRGHGHMADPSDDVQ
jgi:hypothetical protein